MIPKILPEKLDPEGLDSETTDYVHITYNRAIDDCQSALTKAIEDGVICKVPDIKEIQGLIMYFNPPLEMSVPELAKAILTLLKEQK